MVMHRHNTKRAPAAVAIWTACSGVLCDWIHGLYALIGIIDDIDWSVSP